MEGQDLGDDLLRKLRDSRRRFQRRMQQLLEKYNQAFEDAPLVQMSTLTYETPQGLRIWGGRLVTEGDRGHSQDPPEETVSKRGGPACTPASPDLPPSPGTCIGEGPASCDGDATFYDEEVIAGAWVPAAPRSPLSDDLRRKYLTRLDSLLLEDERSAGGDDKDEPGPLLPAPASPASPPAGLPGSPGLQTPSPAEHQPGPAPPADTAVVPWGDCPSQLEASVRSSPAGEADLGSVTLGELYAGMLHSMSCLLRAPPAGLIGARTCILRGWATRRRPRARGRLNRTYCRAGRRAGGGAREPSPPSAPGPGRGALRSCENLRPPASPGPAGAALQVARPGRTSPRLSAWTFLDSSAGRRPDQENRLLSLEWLISPVKLVRRWGPRRAQADGLCRGLHSRFERLHGECCRALALAPAAAATGTASGGPGAARGPQPSRPGPPLAEAGATRLRAAFETPGGRPAGAAGDATPSPVATQSPGRSGHLPGLCRGSRALLLGPLAAPGAAPARPREQPDYGRARCLAIKEKFDALHQRCCPEAPTRPGLSPSKAGAGVRHPREGALGATGPRTWAPSQESLQGPLRSSPVEVRPSAWFMADAQGAPPCPTKRRRLSDPQVCGRWAEALGSWPAAGRTSPRPGEAAVSSHPGQEETKVRVCRRRSVRLPSPDPPPPLP